MEPRESPKKLDSLPIFGAVAIVLIVGGFFLFKKPSQKTTPPESQKVESRNVKEFTIDGSNFQFSQKIITVSKGDNVKITFRDDDGTHNLVLSGYNLATNTLRGGGQDSIEFVADKTGTFDYFCSVANHRDLGMNGTLVVQ